MRVTTYLHVATELKNAELYPSFPQITHAGDYFVISFRKWASSLFTVKVTPLNNGMVRRSQVEKKGINNSLNYCVVFIVYT